MFRPFLIEVMAAPHDTCHCNAGLQAASGAGEESCCVRARSIHEMKTLPQHSRCAITLCKELGPMRSKHWQRQLLMHGSDQGLAVLEPAAVSCL